MIGANALGHGVIGPAVDENVAAFGVDHAVVGLAADDDADADAGAYRYIDTIFDRFGAAPIPPHPKRRR